MGGETNGAYSFDGIDDYISLGSSNRGITDVITISFWIKSSSLADQYPISKYTYFEDAGYFTVFVDGFAGTAGRDGSGSFIFTGYGNTSIADNTWHHILSVIDGNTWKIWVDCQLEQSITTSTPTPSLNNTQSLILGKWGLENIYHYDGLLDEVRIYNRVLSSQEKDLLCDINQFTKIDEMTSEYLSVFPNPATSQVTIQSNTNIEAISIFDETGRIMFYGLNGIDNTESIDVSSWKRGVYFVQFISSEGIETKKLIIQELSL